MCDGNTANPTNAVKEQYNSLMFLFSKYGRREYNISKAITPPSCCVFTDIAVTLKVSFGYLFMSPGP